MCLGLAATLGCNERTDNPASTSNGELQDKVDGNADVIVVGAGTTGASMATALARQGKKVILLERSLDLPVCVWFHTINPHCHSLTLISWGGVAGLPPLL